MESSWIKHLLNILAHLIYHTCRGQKLSQLYSTFYLCLDHLYHITCVERYTTLFSSFSSNDKDTLQEWGSARSSWSSPSFCSQWGSTTMEHFQWGSLPRWSVRAETKWPNAVSRNCRYALYLHFILTHFLTPIFT